MDFFDKGEELMKTKLLTCVFVLVALVMANTASAVIVEDFVANGATDPIGQGFLQFAGITTGTHIAASGGDPQAWQQFDDSSSGGYRINSSSHPSYSGDFGGTEGWTATIQTKLIECGRNCAAFMVQDGAGEGHKFRLDFWDGTDFGGSPAGVFYKTNTYRQ